MKLYQVVSAYFEGCGHGHHQYFATLKEAKIASRTAARETGDEAEVYRIKIKTNLAGIIAFGNEQFTGEKVYTAKSDTPA